MNRVKTNQTGGLLENQILFNTWVEKVYGPKRDHNYYNVQYKMFFTQKDWLCDESEHIRVERIWRFESIEEEFKVMCKELGIKQELPHIKKSSHQLQKPHYEEHNRKKSLVFYVCGVYKWRKIGRRVKRKININIHLKKKSILPRLYDKFLQK